MSKNSIDNKMNKIVSLCKRKGYIFQSSEIYGGLDSCYDYGPLGIELKRNVKEFWWKSMVQYRDDIVGLDAAILMHPRIWEASGHVEGFVDPLIDCKTCKGRFRADQLESTPCPQKPSKMVNECGGELTEVRQFNLMFKTHMGAVEEDASAVYLRPETAQGIYVNYTNVLQSSRQKVPFGIAQIGKAFRNEITPRYFIFRTREFEQMEMQFFVKPGRDEEWFEYWKEQRIRWYDELGIRKENLRFHQHDENELAHYAAVAFDIEYNFPFGWKELEGIHNRTDFDLKRHMEYSGKDLRYFDDATRERFVPYIIETSAGCDRTLLTALVDAYEEEELENDTRTVLRLSPKIAPIKAGIFPLVKRDGMPELAHKIHDDLKRHMMVFYDEGGAVGRRYRRQDEAGTPFCITVDSQTLEDQTVTIRERDSMQQERVGMDAILNYLHERIN
ncbi:glycine--tRNA ligase [candidate division KSB1 bacterium]|nr:glycine--tRNA ligase [candidate division KSB1 bacterium]TDI84965.1 MAG: glycine--tRNA ligase [Caldithrix sp.]